MIPRNRKPTLPALAGRFWLTLSLALTALSLSLTELAFYNSYFDRQLIWQGQYWRLLSGHFTHTSLSHMGWDLIAFTLAVGYVEQRSRTLALICLTAGTLSVNLLLLSPVAEVGRYAGLSGMLFAPLTIALVHFAVTRGTPEAWLPALICLIKLVMEQVSGTALLSQSPWPPYTAAHIAGTAGGLALLCLGRFRTALFPHRLKHGTHRA